MDRDSSAKNGPQNDEVSFSAARRPLKKDLETKTSGQISAVTGRLHGSRGVPALEEFLRAIDAAREATRQSLAEQYIKEARSGSIPIVHVDKGAQEGDVVFLYQGPQRRVTLNSQLPGPRESHEFKKVDGSDLFYLVRQAEADARIDYKFILDDGDWVLDPWNSRTQPSAFGTSSYFWMPMYRVPDFAHHPGTPPGTLEEIEWESEILENSRGVQVYLPPGYANEEGRRYPSVYLHDGIDYIHFTNIVDLADNAIANGRIPPVILVLAPPVEREKEYQANGRFARAICEELVAHVDQAYRTRQEPHWRGTLGASLGGLCALYLAAAHPDVFGNCAGQSSAFFEESLLDVVPLNLNNDSPAKPLRIHLDVGTYEQHYIRDLLAGNRKFAAAIRAKGYPLQYLEVHEGHSWGSWRARIIPALEFFWDKP